VGETHVRIVSTTAAGPWRRLERWCPCWQWRRSA
jgi:hypothetical protein